MNRVSTPLHQVTCTGTFVISGAHTRVIYFSNEFPLCSTIGSSVGFYFPLFSTKNLFQYRKDSTRTGGNYNPATGSEVCQFVYMIVG
jgi:hypothetical protein